MSEIVQRFSHIALDDPERPVMYIPGSTAVRSASAVWHAHLGVRQRMAELGVGPGQLVVSAAGNRPSAVPLLLACLSLRAPLMPVDAGATVTEVGEFASRFGASVIVVPQSAQELAEPSVPLTGDLRVVRCQESPTLYEGAAVLKLTSGSTGLPKAILASEAHLVADGQRIIGAMGICASDVQIAAIPLSHSYGFGNLLMPLLLQGTAIVLRDTFLPNQLLLDARTFNARVFPGVPYMFSYFVANPPADGWPSCLQLLISAGARLDAQMAEAFRNHSGIKIHSFYGTSETGAVAYDAVDTPVPDGHVGSPMPGVSVVIREDEGAPAGSGRVFVRSTSVASGYVTTDDEQESPFQDDGFLTGDFGTLDIRSGITLTGRASVAVNVAGRKVYPAEIERVIRTMEGVEDVCVLAAPDPRRGQHILACIISRQQPSSLEVRRFCAARLAPHKVPRAIVFLPSLPVTARGKTDRARLLTLALEQLDKAAR